MTCRWWFIDASCGPWHRFDSTTRELTNGEAADSPLLFALICVFLYGFLIYTVNKLYLPPDNGTTYILL